MTAPEEKASGPRRRDASMSLLNTIFEEPMEPGYQQAAANRRENGEPEQPALRRGLSPALVIGMLALGLLLTVAALQAQGTAGIASAEREGLIDRIRSQEGQTERLRDTMNDLQAEIAELEDVELRGTAEGQEIRDELQQLQRLTGAVAVSGPGASVLLDDAEDPSAAERPDLARVLDVDLQQVVSGLWMAGAEAISINGHRLTSLTAIRWADNVIHVGYQPIRPPYHVQAVGDSRSLPQEFSEGPGGHFLRAAAGHGGIRYTVRAEESLTLPAASTSLMYATIAEETS